MKLDDVRKALRRTATRFREAESFIALWAIVGIKQMMFHLRKRLRQRRKERRELAEAREKAWEAIQFARSMGVEFKVSMTAIDKDGFLTPTVQAHFHWRDKDARNRSVETAVLKALANYWVMRMCAAVSYEDVTTEKP